MLCQLIMFSGIFQKFNCTYYNFIGLKLWEKIITKNHAHINEI